MTDDIFGALEDDRESELRGEKATKEFEPFSPALLADIYVSKNFYGNNCLTVILVKKDSLGSYYTYDMEIKDKKSMDILKEKYALNKDDEETKKQLTKANMDIRAINIHLYDLFGTSRTEKYAEALSYLQTALKEKSLEVDPTFTSQSKGSFTNYFFKDIKPLNATSNPISQKIIAMIKEDIEKRKEFAAKKRKAENPDQFYREEVNKPVTEENDIPF